LDKLKHVYLEADVGDVILLHKHSIHCSLPNRSNDFRISADLRYNIAGQPSGREPLPNFYVRSKNKKNLNVQNFKQWLALWEKAKEKCIPRKYSWLLFIRYYGFYSKRIDKLLSCNTNNFY
jgi:hypothetical protein